MPSVLFLVPHSLSQHRYMQSQVGGPMRLLRREGYEVRLLSVESDKGFLEQPFFEEIRAFGIEVDSIAAPRLVGTFRLLLKLMRLNADRVYVREIFGGLMALVAGRSKKLLYDVRGAVPEEILFASNGRKTLRYRLYDLAHRLVGRCAGDLHCVSSPLSEHLRRTIGRTATVVPCCVEALPDPVDVGEIRRDLGLGEGAVLCYAGGASRWLMLEAMVGLFAELSRLDPDVEFLILTGDVPYFEDLVERAGGGDLMGRCRFHTAPSREVPRLLQAGDLGVSLRAEHLISEVSSPIKAAEYLAAGIPVLASPGIGDLTEMVTRTECGVVWRPEDGPLKVLAFLKEVRANRASFRSKCRQAAIDRYVWTAHLPRFEALFG